MRETEREGQAMRMTVRQLVIVAALTVVVTAVAFGVVSRWLLTPRRDVLGCMSNVYNLACALEMYAMDYDGRYIPADRWVDLTFDYVRDPLQYRCPRDPSAARSSYGMNSALSGRPAASVPRDVVRLYETAHPGDNPHGGPDDVASPPRHRGGNLYALQWPSAKQHETVPRFEP